MTGKMKLMCSVILFAAMFASFTQAWNCETHTFICEKAGLGDLDCCLADASRTPGFTLHHCANNTDDCDARVAAREYLEAGRPEIAAHLFADAMSPPHWYSFTDEDSSRCHSSFESKVDTRLSPDNTALWPATAIDCHTTDGGVVNLSVDMAYLNQVIAYVNHELQPESAQPTPQEHLGMINPSSLILLFAILLIVVVTVIIMKMWS